MFSPAKIGRSCFNFEFICGETHLVCYITDWQLKGSWFTEAIRLPSDVGRKILVKFSLPRIVESEVTEAIEWALQFLIPLNVLEQYVGPKRSNLAGEVFQMCRGSFSPSLGFLDTH